MPPEGLAGKCGDPASLTFSYDVHPTGSLLYCADRPGLIDGLGVSYCDMGYGGSVRARARELSDSSAAGVGPGQSC